MALNSVWIGAGATVLVGLLTAFCAITWRLLRDLSALKVDIAVIKVQVVETVQVQATVRRHGEHITRLQERVRTHDKIMETLTQ
jgi:hypothetical protein